MRGSPQSPFKYIPVKILFGKWHFLLTSKLSSKLKLIGLSIFSVTNDIVKEYKLVFTSRLAMSECSALVQYLVTVYEWYNDTLYQKFRKYIKTESTKNSNIMYWHNTCIIYGAILYIFLFKKCYSLNFSSIYFIWILFPLFTQKHTGIPSALLMGLVHRQF